MKGEGYVEHWGFSKNIEDVLARSAIVVLPSYREGFPKVLIEAAACGMPIIADWEMETDFHGAWRAPRDIIDMHAGYVDIMERKDWYIQSALNTAKELSWFNRSKDIVEIYQQFV